MSIDQINRSRALHRLSHKTFDIFDPACKGPCAQRVWKRLDSSRGRGTAFALKIKVGSKRQRQSDCVCKHTWEVGALKTVDKLHAGVTALCAKLVTCAADALELPEGVEFFQSDVLASG
jgi:hypothetical protein